MVVNLSHAEASDPPLPADFNMLDALLNNIDENYTINDATPDDQDTADAAKTLCENELYQLLLGNDFKMKMRNTETQVYNCMLLGYYMFSQTIL